MKIIEGLSRRVSKEFSAMVKDKEYWHSIWIIGLPVALQSLFSAGLNLIDSIMVGQLGDEALAAVGIANTIFFLMIVFMFGIGSGSSIFIAQFYGKKDEQSVRSTMAVGFVFSLISSLMFMVATLVWAEAIMTFFTNDTAVIRLGADYLKIVSISYPLSAIANLFYSGLRSIKRAALPLLVAGIAILANTVLNYLLINGIGIFPEMGVSGAALATSIARFLEIILIFSVVYLKRLPISIYRRDFLKITKPFLKKILVVTTPVILNEGLWALGASSYTLLWSRMDTVYMAGFNILQTVNRITFALSMGMAAATAAMVGHKIGEKKSRVAFTYASRTNLLNFIAAIFIGILLFFSSSYIVGIFGVSPQAKEYAIEFIRLFSIMVPILTLNFVNMLGALRGGGDTRYAFLLDILPLWLWAMPLAFAAGWVWKLPLAVVFLITTSDELFKLFFGLKRFRSGKWINEMKGLEELEN